MGWQPVNGQAGEDNACEEKAFCLLPGHTEITVQLPLLFVPVHHSVTMELS